MLDERFLIREALLLFAVWTLEDRVLNKNIFLAIFMVGFSKANRKGSPLSRNPYRVFEDGR